MGDITANFSDSEFLCQCGLPCALSSQSNIYIPFVRKLQEIRNQLGPMLINSGSRCVAYNRKVGGVLNSKHLAIYKGKSLAADIHCVSRVARHKMIREAINLGLSVGINETFIHLDARKIPVLFTY